MGAALEVNGLRHRRGGREVLRVDELTVPSGTRLSVLGPNGAGKTTLLRLLAALERPDHGNVHIGGIDAGRGGVELRRRVAFATQRATLLSTTVRRNVEIPLRWRKVPRKQRSERALAALERLGVAHLVERPAPELSGGEQQRVNLARALALQPAILLLDEPAASLDTATRGTFLADLTQALAETTTTLVHVSHRADEVMQLADRVVALVGGQVHQDAAPETLTSSPVDPDVAGLLGYENIIDGYAEADGRVLVDNAATGLTWSGRSGPVTIAAFAGGVGLESEGSAGIPMRIDQVRAGPGHRVITLRGTVSLVAAAPVTADVRRGEVTRVTLDPALSVVLPKDGTR